MNDHAAGANPAKLFVGNIPFSVTEEQLTDIFAPHGTLVQVKLVIDQRFGRSRGIAFVEYSTAEEAQAAIAALNGTDMGGRALVVNVARPQAPRSDRPRSFDRGGNGGGYGRRDDRGGDRRGGFGGGRRSSY